jgi:staphylococcal nuclease domain-containing protein 1
MTDITDASKFYMRF